MQKKTKLEEIDNMPDGVKKKHRDVTITRKGRL